MMNHSDPLNLDGKLKKALESFVESNVTPPKEGSLLSREQIIQNTVEELHKGLLPNEEELQKTLIRARLLLDQIGMSLLDQHSFDRLEKVFNDPLFTDLTQQHVIFAVLEMPFGLRGLQACILTQNDSLLSLSAKIQACNMQ